MACSRSLTSPRLSPFLGLALLGMAEPAISKIRARTRKRFIPSAAGALLLDLWLLALLPRPGWACFRLATAILRQGCRQGLRNLFLSRARRLTAHRDWFRCRLRCPVAFGAIGAEAFTLGTVAFWAIGAAVSFFGGLVVSLGPGSFVEGGHGPVRSLPSSVRCLNIPRPDSSHGPRYLQISSDSSGESVDHFRTAWTVTSLSWFLIHGKVYPFSIAVPGGRCPRWAVLTNGYFFAVT